MDVLSRELGRQKIDKNIQFTVALLCSLKARRNTFAPISQLPTELFSKIFITISCSYFSSSNGLDLSWIRCVTAVCSQWRAIALSCPGLWCRINFGRPIWAEEMLKRSKMTPLIIQARQYTPRMIPAVHAALQHISRIRELHLAAPKVIIKKLIDRIDKRDAPLMQSLHLSNKSEGDEYALPETLFVDDDHHLQRLELINCIISWDSPLLCSLIHLKLHKSNDRPRPTMMKVLDALEKMPLLETLDLAGWLPTVDDSFISRIVRLPHLTSLSLSSFAAECAYLLSHISYPATTSLSLSCILSTPDDVFLLSDAISPAWNGSDGSKLLRTLDICGRVDSTTLRGWITNETDVYYESEPARIEVTLRWTEDGDEESANAIFEVCNALTLTNLRSLFVSGIYCTLEVTWLSAFGHSTSLRTLHVDGIPTYELVSALSTIPEENLAEEDDLKGKVFLPSLRALWLKDVNDMQPFRDREFREDLRDCLMTRCHWNAEVQFLHIECEKEHYDQVKLLREIVVDVDCRVW